LRDTLFSVIASNVPSGAMAWVTMTWAEPWTSPNRNDNVPGDDAAVCAERTAAVASPSE
jgi:hypothetical protein